DDLANSGDILIDQSFEQIRSTLSQTHDDPAVALSRSPGLRALLESSTAFGKVVISWRIDGPGGQVLVAAPAYATPVTTTPVQRFATLESNAASWRGLARIYMVWGESAYELSRPVELNGRPWGEISIGLSTALMSAELHRSVKETVLFAVSAVLLGLLGAMI